MYGSVCVCVCVYEDKSKGSFIAVGFESQPLLGCVAEGK
jgi:hypothetical protein